MRGTHERGAAGGGVSYEHRATRRLSAFARAELARRWGDASAGVEFGALGGVRLRF